MPVAFTFTPGDGGRTVGCAGPGEVWTPAVGQSAQAPDACDYACALSTYSYPGVSSRPPTGSSDPEWDPVGADRNFPRSQRLFSSRFAVAQA